MCVSVLKSLSISLSVHIITYISVPTNISLSVCTGREFHARWDPSLSSTFVLNSVFKISLDTAFTSSFSLSLFHLSNTLLVKMCYLTFS